MVQPGAAYEDYVNADPKLLNVSEAILEAALDAMVQEGVRFVIIPGDLTKDGELVNHVVVAQHLAKLQQHGIQAYVVPGNHDLNNPDAAALLGDRLHPVPTVGPAQFQAIYKRFGYLQAMDRDTESLSYVVEPAPGLWLLALDSTDAARNQELGYPMVSGQLSPTTLAWVQLKLTQAQAQGKRVIAFMHHGVNPDFLAQPVLFPEYLVNSFPAVNLTLAGAGLRAIFTGHYHAQDASYLFDETWQLVSPLCDVETGSLVTFPCTYRVVTVLPEGLLNLETRRVTQINADTGGVPFQEYAEADIRIRTLGIVIERLKTSYGATPEQAAMLGPLVVDALVAGYVGDEDPDPETQAIIESLLGSGDPLLVQFGQLLYALWTDLPGPDNNTVIPYVAN